MSISDYPSSNSDADPPEMEVVASDLVYSDSQPTSRDQFAPNDAQSTSRSLWLFLLVLFVGLFAILAGPSLLARFRYADTRAKIQAEVDAATEGLPKVKAQLSDLVDASRLVVKRVSPSVVSIRRADMRGEQGQGSGVIVDKAGYIVTNYHVVKDASGLLVRLADGREANAGVVGGDPRIDLAVLKINLPDLVAADWGDSEALEVGDLVWALGSPFGLDRTVTFGIVSAKQRRTGSGIARNVYQEYLQTDVAINPGNSGGPLVDLEGQVVGINTMIVGDTFQGVSFAIPSRLVRNTYDKMREVGWIERGYLGVSPQPVPASLRRRMQLAPGEGVLVATVSSLTPADQAGLLPLDVILRWGNHFASEPFLLVRAIADAPVGSKVPVVVKRIVRNRPVEIELIVTVGSVPRL